VNLAILTGNLGADPELRTSQKGTAILKLRLATKDREKVGDQWQDRTEWHSVVVFGARAEGLSRVLAKGKPIGVRGQIRTSSYEKEGIKVYKTEIIADDVELLGSGGGQRQPSTSYQATPDQAQDMDPPGDDSDVPF
jgi:single-strand DNA-binding protein